MTEDQVRHVALRLIQAFGRYGATMKAGRPTIEFRLAKARFDGMAEIAAVALKAPTPFALEVKLIDFERSHGKMPSHSASNKEYRAWEAAMLRDFLAANAEGWY